MDCDPCIYNFKCTNQVCTSPHNFNNYKCIYNLWIHKWKQYICQLPEYSSSKCNQNIKTILYETEFRFNTECWNPNI